jgi:hypothetical protein
MWPFVFTDDDCVVIREVGGRTVLTLKIDCVYDIPAGKWAYIRRSSGWQDKCFVSVASTISCGMAHPATGKWRL